MNAPLVPLWILTIPASAALLLLLLAHVRRRGWREGLLVLIAAAVFWSLRENLQIRQMLLPHDYEVSSAALVRIGRAPIFVIVGWAFAGLLAWHLAERVLERARGWQMRCNPLMALFITIFIVQSISYLTEVAGTIAGWWVWGRAGQPWYDDLSLYEEWHTSYLVSIPDQPLEGWAMYELFFLGPLVLSTGFLRGSRILSVRRALLAGAICLGGYAVLFAVLVLPGWLSHGEFVITSSIWAAIFGLIVLLLSFLGWKVDPLGEADQAKSGPLWDWIERWGDKGAALIYLFICLAVISEYGALYDYLSAIPFVLFALLALWRTSGGAIAAVGASIVLLGLLLGRPTVAYAPVQFLIVLALLALWRAWQRRAPRIFRPVP